jgi:predicted DNA-binding protein YlxM (UPF0122 family)
LPFSEDDLLLEQRVRFGELFDLYSLLLTEKQRVACELLLGGDLSIAELGDELGMTRQGAYDLVKRSRDFLDEIERGLGLLSLRVRCGAILDFVSKREAELPRELVSLAKNLFQESPEEGEFDV